MNCGELTLFKRTNYTSGVRVHRHDKVFRYRLEWKGRDDQKPWRVSSLFGDYAKWRADKLEMVSRASFATYEEAVDFIDAAALERVQTKGYTDDPDGTSFARLQPFTDLNFRPDVTYVDPVDDTFGNGRNEAEPSTPLRNELQAKWIEEAAKSKAAEAKVEEEKAKMRKPMQPVAPSGAAGAAPVRRSRGRALRRSE